MSLEFSEHAKRQLKRRNISQKIVRKAVYEPQKTLSSFRGRKLRRMKVGGKILEVVTRTEGSTIIVVTAYFLKENK